MYLRCIAKILGLAFPAFSRCLISRTFYVFIKGSVFKISYVHVFALIIEFKQQ